MDCQLKNNFIDAMMKFKKLLSALSNDMDIRFGEYMLVKNLSALIEEHSTVYVSDVYKLLHISKPAVSQLLNVLDKKGYIKREISCNDHRKIALTITPAGMEMLREKERISDEFFNRIISILGESDMNTIVGAITRFADSAYEVSRQHLEEASAAEGVLPVVEA